MKAGSDSVPHVLTSLATIFGPGDVIETGAGKLTPCSTCVWVLAVEVEAVSAMSTSSDGLLKFVGRPDLFGPISLPGDGLVAPCAEQLQGLRVL